MELHDSFLNVLHDVLVNLKPQWIENGDEGYQVDSDEEYEEDIHTLIVKNVDTQDKTKETLNYTTIGEENIHALNYEAYPFSETLLFLFFHQDNYYLVKSFYEMDDKSFSCAMKSTSIEALVKNLPKEKSENHFSKEDTKYLAPFLEKELLEKQLSVKEKTKNHAKL